MPPGVNQGGAQGKAALKAIGPSFGIEVLTGLAMTSPGWSRDDQPWVNVVITTGERGDHDRLTFRGSDRRGQAA
jgi:hypothetical protein